MARSTEVSDAQPAAKGRIAYLINQYPKVSHSFIRREIHALERLGHEVERIAVRGWRDPVVDASDKAERQRTRYVLERGVFSLIVAALGTAATRPLRFWSALRVAIRASCGSDRSWPYHLIYLAEACRVLGWLQASAATHLHAHFGTNPAEVAMLVHALGGPPFSFTVHGPEEFDKPEALGLAEKITRAAFVVAVSSYGRSQLYRWVRQSSWAKVKVVGCGLESTFHAVNAGLPSAAPRLVCVGRLCEQKGQLLLVEAASRLVSKGLALELVLAGDGEMRAEVEELVARLGLAATVRITGWISSDQVREEILASRALVLASFAEGLPVVLMEAMALRRPVISTYVAGIPELIRDGQEGWLCAAGDVDALAAAMEACLRAPTEVLARMANSAHERVLQRHDIDVEASKLSDHFAAAALVSGA